MSAGRTLLPWAHRSGTYALPTSLLVRLKLGEVPGDLPAMLDVRCGRAEPAAKTGHGAFDRVASTFGGAIRISRLHAASAALAGHGGRYSEDEELSGVSRVLRVEVEPGTHIGSMAISLMQLGIVESAIPNYLVSVGLVEPLPVDGTDDDGWTPREAIRAPAAMAYEPGDPALVVGVVDSGLALHHPEFGDRNRVRAGMDTVRLATGDLAGGVQLLGDNHGLDTNPDDRFVGHGSGCAAIIGARGVGMPPGLAGACQILPVRSLGAAVFPGRLGAVGVGALADLDAGLVMAIQLGARVVNMSFGTDDEALEPGAPKPHTEAVDFATRRGVTLVAASGNSGDRRVYWPAAYEDVIAVGAVGPEGKVSEFTTTGDHVAFCAPGEQILTAAVDGYQRATGTSFAAPFAAAAAALLVSRAQRRSAALDPAMVKALLAAGARPHVGPAAGAGTGVLDVQSSLVLLDQALDADDSTEIGGEADG